MDVWIFFQDFSRERGNSFIFILLILSSYVPGENLHIFQLYHKKLIKSIRDASVIFIIESSSRENCWISRLEKITFERGAAISVAIDERQRPSLAIYQALPQDQCGLSTLGAIERASRDSNDVARRSPATSSEPRSRRSPVSVTRNRAVVRVASSAPRC